VAQEKAQANAAMSDKPKFPRAVALQAAREVLAVLTPACERIIVAGSLRRKREHAGDVEIVYITKRGEARRPGALFPETCDLADVAIAELELAGTLTRRLSKTGNETFGPKNKLMLHVSSGVPFDLFAITAGAWFSYLVCRTGPAMFNVALAERAKALGYAWHPYKGFERLSDHKLIEPASEHDVFTLLGLDYLEPWERQ
jgi:DNA polymerase/3'-5' exonuclease PolX